MTGLEALSVDMDAIWGQLALGYDLFGPNAAWLWLVPAIWAATAILLWAYTSWYQRRSDRAYLDYASRQLPILRRIAKHRAHEVAFFRRTDDF